MAAALRCHGYSYFGLLFVLLSSTFPFSLSWGKREEKDSEKEKRLLKYFFLFLVYLKILFFFLRDSKTRVFFSSIISLTFFFFQMGEGGKRKQNRALTLFLSCLWMWIFFFFFFWRSFILSNARFFQYNQSCLRLYKSWRKNLITLSLHGTWILGYLNQKRS